MPLKYDTALITGASAGLGEEFAHQLAACSRQLVLVSRRRSYMEDLARILRGAYPGLEVHVLECDLAKPEAVEQLVGALAGRGLVPDLLVNNAGLALGTAAKPIEASRTRSVATAASLTPGRHRPSGTLGTPWGAISPEDRISALRRDS